LGSGERDAVTTLATLRFESIGHEYVMSEKLPKVGDVLRRNGDNWVVKEIREEKDGTSTVTLRPGLKPAGS
jgi:hypothetical protein